MQSEDLSTKISQVESVAVWRGQMEPIIAVIIMMSVAAIIVIALVGWILGLWGELPARGLQIAVENPVLCAGHGNITAAVYIKNTDDEPDKILSVYLSYAEDMYEGEIVANMINTSAGERNIVPAKSAGWLYMKFAIHNEMIKVGDLATIRIEFEKSKTKTVTVRALECEVLRS